ncbi:hypothetical protein PC116_g33066 [Phytophthora cactorum]|nr:hypothetical protein PC116_g33066 [Phytophthora cactorum]
MNGYVLLAIYTTILIGLVGVGVDWLWDVPEAAEVGEYFLQAAFGGTVGFMARRHFRLRLRGPGPGPGRGRGRGHDHGHGYGHGRLREFMSPSPPRGRPLRRQGSF